MVEFEKRGVPTVSFTAEKFVRDAHRSAENFGLPGLALAVVPHPFTNAPEEQVDTMVDESLDQIVAGWTQPVPDEVDSELPAALDSWLTYEGDDLIETVSVMNRKFLDYGWSDGFPLRPPVRKEMAAMLDGTSRPADDVVAILEPGFGLATVEKIAANAVMAGCRPEHLPVVIAAVECLAEPVMYIRNKAMSTGPAAPLLIVNGPIIDQIDLNSGVCTLGPGSGSYANTVIGRAVRLCMMNVGHAYPGVADMDAVGTPAKYSMCVAENEADNPWTPYHVEQGFAPDDSTVTVQFTYGLCDLCDLENEEPERLIQTFATAALNVAQIATGMWLIGRRADPRSGTEEKEHHVLLLSEQHSRMFAQAGWSKDDIRAAMHKNARLPFKTLMLNKEPKAMQVAHPELQWLWESPDTMLPVVEDPSCWDLVVQGALVGRGTFFWGSGQPVTKKINP